MSYSLPYEQKIMDAAKNLENALNRQTDKRVQQHPEFLTALSDEIEHFRTTVAAYEGTADADQGLDKCRGAASRIHQVYNRLKEEFISSGRPGSGIISRWRLK